MNTVARLGCLLALALPALSFGTELPGGSVASEDGLTSFMFECSSPNRGEFRTECEITKTRLEAMGPKDDPSVLEAMVRIACDQAAASRKVLADLESGKRKGDKVDIADSKALARAFEAVCKDKNDSQARKQLATTWNDWASRSCGISVHRSKTVFELTRSPGAQDFYWKSLDKAPDSCGMVEQERLKPRKTEHGVEWIYEQQQQMIAPPSRENPGGQYGEELAALRAACYELDQTVHIFASRPRMVRQPCDYVFLPLSIPLKKPEVDDPK